MAASAKQTDLQGDWVVFAHDTSRYDYIQYIYTYYIDIYDVYIYIYTLYCRCAENNIHAIVHILCVNIQYTQIITNNEIVIKYMHQSMYLLVSLRFYVFSSIYTYVTCLYHSLAHA